MPKGFLQTMPSAAWPAEAEAPPTRTDLNMAAPFVRHSLPQQTPLACWKCKTHAPCFCWAALSCRKPLKGASPVPGPTITSGVEGLAGSLNWLRRTNMGTVSPTAARFRKCEHTPSCMRPAQAEKVMSAWGHTDGAWHRRPRADHGCGPYYCRREHRVMSRPVQDSTSLISRCSIFGSDSSGRHSTRLPPWGNWHGRVADEGPLRAQWPCNASTVTSTPVGTRSCTTAQVTWMLWGCWRGEEEME